MAKKKQKKKKKMPEQVQRPKDFLDMIAPAAVKFNTDHFILGSRYHTAMALKSYPPMTDELALLRGLGDMGGVNLRLTARQVTPAEEDAILHAATNKSRMERSNTNDYKQSVTAEANLRDMAELRLKNPDASLEQLGEMLDPPLGKSGVNHRLRKIMQYAQASGAPVLNGDDQNDDPEAVPQA